MQVGLVKLADRGIVDAIKRSHGLPSLTVVAAELADRSCEQRIHIGPPARGRQHSALGSERYIAVIAGASVSERSPVQTLGWRGAKHVQGQRSQCAQRGFPRAGVGLGEFRARARFVMLPHRYQTKIVMTYGGERGYAGKQRELMACFGVAAEAIVGDPEIVAELWSFNSIAACFEEIGKCPGIIPHTECRGAVAECLDAGNRGVCSGCRKHAAKQYPSS